MRTRRSPRNQERLWRLLGKALLGPTPPKAEPIDAIAVAERALATPFVGRRTRQMLKRDLARAKAAKARRESGRG